MHKFPKSGIKKILGMDVRIEFVDELDDGCSLGECLSDQGIIRIVSKQKKYAKIETLIHEEIEFLNHKMVLNLTHDQVEQLTTGISSIIGGTNEGNKI